MKVETRKRRVSNRNEGYDINAARDSTWEQSKDTRKSKIVLLGKEKMKNCGQGSKIGSRRKMRDAMRQCVQSFR
jgi:hypothetical protein